jgi:hypothetical protein
VLPDNFEMFCIAFQNETYPQAFTHKTKLQQISTGPTTGTDKIYPQPYEYYVAHGFLSNRMP